MQNPHVGSKIKIPQNMSKSILQIIYSCYVQKTTRKKTKNSSKEIIFKIGHHAKAIAHAKKDMSKSILQITYSCSDQKTAQKRPNIREMRPF